MTQKRKNIIPNAKTFMAILEHFVFVSIFNIFKFKVKNLDINLHFVYISLEVICSFTYVIFVTFSLFSCR